jgi:hypothetical protein
MNEMDKKRLLSFRKQNFLTWGKLKELAAKHNVPDDALIVAERVEDYYFDKGDWEVYCKDNEMSLDAEKYNKKIKRKKRKDEDDLYTEKDIQDLKSQYHPIWSPVFYQEDPEVLFLDLHY